MTVSYLNTEDDLRVFFDYYVNETAEGRRQRYLHALVIGGNLLGVMVLPLVLVFALGVYQKSDFKAAVEFLLLLFAVAMLVLFTPTIRRQRVRRMAQKSAQHAKSHGGFRKQNVTALPDRIERKSDVSLRVFRWEVVDQAVKHHDHIFLFVDGNLECLVPIRAFADRAQFDEFYAAIENYRRLGGPPKVAGQLT